MPALRCIPRLPITRCCSVSISHRAACEASLSLLTHVPMPLRSGFHSRGYLPHLKVEGATYFVTFRLADSLPKEVLLRLKAQRDDLLRKNSQLPPELVHQERGQPFEGYASEIDALLDRSNGESWLGRASIASIVASALNYFASTHYELSAWVVMPNHVHAVIRPLLEHTLDEILHSWKSYTANQANRLLNRSGNPFWQKETYDHWIRDETDHAHCCQYTETNPVKAGLCARPEDWCWSSASQK